MQAPQYLIPLYCENGFFLHVLKIFLTVDILQTMASYIVLIGAITEYQDKNLKAAIFFFGYENTHVVTIETI